MHICLIFIIGARSITLFIQWELGRWCGVGEVGGGGGGKEGFSLCTSAYIHNCCKKYRIIYSEGVGEVGVVLQGGGGWWRESGGGGGGERVRRATITGKLAIDLNNGVKS